MIKNPLRKRIRHIMFEATTRCNHDCLHCYNIWKNFPDYPQEELQTEKTKELLDIIINSMGVKQISITGGEPTLRQDLEDLVLHATRRGIEISLLTNGSLLTDDRIKSLTKCGMVRIQLPLLGGIPHLHNQMSAHKSFKNVIRSMKCAKNAGVQVIGVFVVTKKNLNELTEVIKICVGLDIDGLLFNRLVPTGRSLDHMAELKLSKEDLANALTIADKAVSKYGLPIMVGTIIHPCIINTKLFKNLEFAFCPAGRTKDSYYTVDPLGNLRICNNSPEILGNLFKDDFWKMHKSKSVKRFVESYPHLCEPCDLKYRCCGGCKTAALICFGNIYEAEPFLKDNAQHIKYFK